MTTQQMATVPKVIVIPATLSQQELVEKKRKRVYGYGRVSTDSDEQTTSLESQESYIINKIKANCDWEYCGYIEDEGITGTSVKRRAGFKKLMQLCRAGKVDLILTKSISRFSRNTLDSIGYVRMLKSMGVGVIFDKEGVNTMDASTDLVFTLFSAVAQAESESISGNIKIGKREGYRQGKVSYRYKNWYGYRQGVSELPEIVPEEAQVVKNIFNSYLAGYSLNQIADALNEKGVPVRGTAKRWAVRTIQDMLKNERYCGNVLLQKTFVTDCITKQIKKNTGQLPQYLVQGAHMGIVTEQTYNLVQAETTRRNALNTNPTVAAKAEKSKYSALYALSDLLVCGDCGTRYRRKTWKNYDGSPRIVWCCLKRLEQGKKACGSPALDEYRMQDAIMNALQRHSKAEIDLKEMILRNTRLAVAGQGHNPYALRSQMTQLEQSLAQLVAISTKVESAEVFEGRFKQLSEEIVSKKQELEELEASCQKDETLEQKIALAQQTLCSLPDSTLSYHNTLVRLTIQRITVLDEDTLKIQFIDGVETTIQMEARK